MTEIRRLFGVTAILAVITLAALANEVNQVVPESDFIEEQSPDFEDSMTKRIEDTISKAILSARSQADPALNEVQSISGTASGSSSLHETPQDLTPDAAKIEVAVKTEEAEKDALAAKVAVGQATVAPHDVVDDLIHPSKHDPVDANVKEAFPLGVKETEKVMKDAMPPPFDVSQASLGMNGHYHLGGGRRRVGAGFGRRRRTTLPPTPNPTPVPTHHQPSGSGSGSGSAIGSAAEALQGAPLDMKAMMQTVLEGTVFKEDQILKDDDMDDIN